MTGGEPTPPAVKTKSARDALLALKFEQEQSEQNTRRKMGRTKT